MVVFLIVALWAAQIITALILFQTLFFKFTGAPESIFIFSTLGLEPWGRYLVGVAELVAGILLFFPKTAVYGAVLGVLIIVPAIFFHLTKLGISVQGDGGLLFGLAVTVLVLCCFIIWQRFGQLKALF